MRDELARSMAGLRLGELDRPYFIAYGVREARSMEVSATCDSLLASSDSDTVRTFAAQVRVGDYALDNSNFLSMPSFSLGTIQPQFGFNELPIDDDYLEIRRQMWLATDGAYKQALEQLAQKKAALQNSTRVENLPDFSRESPTQTTEIEPPIEMKRSDAEALVRQLSKALGTLPGLQTSMVRLSVANGRSLYLNSEGTFYEKSQPLIALSAAASTQAMDGMRLGDSVSFYARSLGGLPPRDQIASRTEEMARRLTALRDAPLLDRYNGPALFEGRAAAEIFGEEFAPALIGRRKPVSGTSEMDAVMAQFGRLQAPSFAGSIGSRVLPDFLSVVDDPTLAAYGQEPLLGGYKVDDEGVPAHETRLVESGILRTFLTDRTPVDGVGRSTGNRRGTGAIPSNLLVQVSAGLGETELRSRLLELVKKRGLEYGIVVSELGSSSGTSMGEQALAMISTMTGQAAEGRGVLVAYKVYPDGHEESIRGARLSGMSPESFKDIVAASKAATVFHSAQMPRFDFSSSFFMSLGAEMGGSPSLPMVSYVVPSLLFEDLSLTKPSGETPRPPFSNPPPCAQ
ncbi:MAG TPA: metallopeptidase TldD-related protein [Candidatus Acidoferrales bacterium]|nr:metallopeptidase TldD-related protein [Candidatus Acidoferrales bacterium]